MSKQLGAWFHDKPALGFVVAVLGPAVLGYAALLVVSRAQSWRTR